MNKIWKLQRPIMSTEPELAMMAYTKDHRTTAIIPATKEELDDLFGDELKIYVKAKINRKTGNLEINGIVEEQSW